MVFSLAIAGLNHLAKTAQVNHYQVLERHFVDKIRKEVDNVVAAFENWVYDNILTAMYSVVIPMVEIAVLSNTGSSKQGPATLLQNLDQRCFCGKLENTPRMTAFR